MLTSLTIKRFRGISSLTLDDLGRVNILVGSNGVGKTTVLEVLPLIGNPTQPGIVASLGVWRESPALNSANDEALGTLFHNGDLAQGPTFTFVAEGQEQRFEIKAATGFGTDSMPAGSTTVASTTVLSETPWLIGCDWVFHPKPDDEYISTLILHDTGFSQQVQPQKVYKGVGCFYIHGRRSTSVGETANLLTRLYQSKQSDRFLDAVRAIDPRVVGFQPGVRGAAPTVLVDFGLPTLLPMNVVGDGFCRVALISTGLLFPHGKLVAVDEIDSGLHTSVMTRVWKAISDLSVREGKQLFCTTHSDEMLERTLEAFEDSPDLLRIFRLDRLEDGTTVATKYSLDRFRKADLAAVDIR